MNKSVILSYIRDKIAELELENKNPCTGMIAESFNDGQIYAFKKMIRVLEGESN